MFPKSFPISRGCHISSLTAKALLAGAVLTAFAGLAVGPASASNIIYQDSFTGSSTTPLNGAAPTVGPAGVTWTADPAWNADGSMGANAGWDDAYLPFAPTSGQIYTLSEGISVTAGAAGTNAEYDWMGLVFSQSGALGQAPFTNGGPLINSGVPNTPGANQITTYSAPGGVGGAAYNYQGTGVQNLQMTLNTAGANWAVQFSDNGTLLGSYTYASQPTIADVGFGTLSAIGQVSNFELTSSPAPVPEPATLGLFAIGGAIGLLMLKRRAA